MKIKILLNISLLITSTLLVTNFTPVIAQISTSNLDEYPNYCKFTQYANSQACIGSSQDYCKFTQYADSQACIGSSPDYCKFSQYANSRACRKKVD